MSTFDENVNSKLRHSKSNLVKDALTNETNKMNDKL